MSEQRSAPVVRDVHVGPAHWLYAAARYPTPFMARVAWERLEHATRAKQRELDETGGVGIYRHGPTDDPGTIVSVIGLEGAHTRIERALRVLGQAGEDYPLDQVTLEALIVRRSRIVLAHKGETGRMIGRRPDGRGAILTPGGDIIEPPPGRG